MSDLPANPLDAAIVDELARGLDLIPVSLPPVDEVLAGAGGPGGRAAAGHGLTGFLTRWWPYVAGVTLVVLATAGIGAGIQLHTNSEGSPSTSGPPTIRSPSPAPSSGSQSVGGVPGSTPAPSTAPATLITPVPTSAPPQTVAATPAPRTPVAVTTPVQTPKPTSVATPPPTPVPTTRPVPTPTPNSKPTPPSTPSPAATATPRG